MRTSAKVGSFGAGLTLMFGAAFGVGSAAGPIGGDEEPAHADGHGDREPEPRAPAAPGGLQISERGYTLAVPDRPLTAGRETELRLSILGPDGSPLTRYQRTHERELHLILVRRDLSGYQHLHPERAADGTWSVPLTVEEAGAYRLFADFSPAGDEDGPLTLGADLAVAGPHEPAPLPEPATTATVHGYTVTLEGGLAAGGDSELTLNVSRDGRPVTDLEPHLGAYGHLVALRAGDLGYLHVHPQGEPGDGTTAPGPGITFHAAVPGGGTYRLYLDFRHEGAVHTAEFTVATSGAGGHGH
ncbi:hypothetical protein [Streptomyces sp. MP131-18]|uniref:hypothetical protein n=1 Tax=Streptomyces sp. MP131-18 TaxID=1857892 RepID=UPI00097C107C|nr:hypothetical protein [Streptomyces sp. MP131-18]ONK15840.1 hypothetical protein STBA_66810 [Streptomyces sp. MP131-18]